MRTPARACTHTHTRTHARTHTHTHTHIRTHDRPHASAAHTHWHTHTYARTTDRTHARAHTHTHLASHTWNDPRHNQQKYASLYTRTSGTLRHNCTHSCTRTDGRMHTLTLINTRAPPVILWLITLDEDADRDADLNELLCIRSIKIAVRELKC